MRMIKKINLSLMINSKFVIFLPYCYSGDYILRFNDHIAYRYQILKSVGKGSFGKVVKVKDHKLNKTCCIKMIKSNKKF